ncbi:carboxymuconolactone decarboxylase family protein [Sphingobium nicotianae]|uniref:Carboxymuconolactone decarboxylase family protein n=1 Tax=Sphingobium nicotianae TaxID=2782607 RepID=A0A9X1DAF9_9SPHN|nr:carboxymuconolactone decarboxylase family protein [Sphingobium nicotianae]MBT2186336.1 carboxymuconolactone decarboxylase family protein [Sphingobium nicotianae]
MRTKTPRLPPLRDDELDAEQEEVVERFRKTGSDYAIARTFLRHRRALQAYNAFASHTFSADNTLSKRQSEIVTMRTVWRCRAGYQWTRHISMALNAGLDRREIEALKRPVEQGAWTEGDATLIRCVDALTADFYLSDDLWAQLKANFDEKQCIDAILLCGRYTMAAMLVNTAGTQIDPGLELDPDLDMS